jgi:hypothetical protein
VQWYHYVILALDIPLSDDEFLGENLYFNKWIPTEKNSIYIEDDLYILKLWIDKTCISSLSDKTDDEISQWTNISVSKFKIEVKIKNINKKLIDFIYHQRNHRKPEYTKPSISLEEYSTLNNEFNKLGIDILKIVYKSCNRLIAYARNNKGQYHLEQLRYNENHLSSLYIRTNAKCKIRDKEWFRWSPSNIDCISSSLTTEGYITESDWNDISTFVKGQNSISLAKELLSNSRSLLFKFEHRRSAVIEASTALEVTLSNFSKNPNLEKLNYSINTNRIDISNLKNQIKHLGFSGSIKYLIPILFNEKILSSVILSKVYKAIEARNNIVHEGQRNISSEKAKEHIIALKECCEVLIEHTIVEPNKYKETNSLP